MELRGSRESIGLDYFPGLSSFQSFKSSCTSSSNVGKENT